MKDWKEFILWTRGDQWREPIRLSDAFVIELDPEGGKNGCLESAIEYDDIFETTTFHCILTYCNPNSWSTFRMNFQLVKCYNRWAWIFDGKRIELPELPIKYIDPILSVFLMVGQKDYKQEGDFDDFLLLMENFELSLSKIMFHPKRDDFINGWKSQYGHGWSRVYITEIEFIELIQEYALYDAEVLATWSFRR